MKKIRSSQRAISVLNWVKHRPFPVYIVKSKIYDNRSSRPKVFCKKDVLKNFEIFTRKQLCWSLFLIKLKFCEILRTPSLKNIFLFFFSISLFFHEHSRITGLQGKGEGISLTPRYHFHPLHRYLDISRTITAESSPLHIASNWTRWFPSLSH